MQFYDDEMRLLGDLLRGRVSRGLVKRGVALGLSTSALVTLVKAHEMAAQGGEPSGEVVYALTQHRQTWLHLEVCPRPRPGQTSTSMTRYWPGMPT